MWFAAPLQAVLNFDMPDDIANDIGVLDNTLVFQFSLLYWEDDSTGSQSNINPTYIPYGSQTAAEVQICMDSGVTKENFGTTYGNRWVQVSATLGASWTSTVTGELIVVTWNADYIFGDDIGGQFYPSYITYMNIGPYGLPTIGTTSGTSNSNVCYSTSSTGMFL